MAYNTAEPRAEYSANAEQTVFDFVFKIFSISDLKVYSTPFGQIANDETDILIENIDYTVSINGDNGGTVTLTNPAGIDDVVVLLRDLPVKRDYEYQQGGDLSSDTLNDDQDYQTYLLADTQRDSDRFLKLPDTAIIASNILPPIISDGYLKWNEDGTELQYDTSIPDAAILSTDAALIAESYATEPENVFVKTYNNGVPTPTTDYSALHWAAKSEGFAGDSDDSAVESQLSRWLSDAAKLTAQSYATEPEDVFVKTYSSDGDGTFTATNTTDYSSLHWAAKSKESAQGLAENISFNNSGTGIAATDVQDALVELDSEASNHINLSGITAYHLLQGNLSATINANYVEASATTTRNYTTSDYIFDSLNNKLYDCILASTSGTLLTNTTYFTLITAGALQLNTALVPFANGIDSNGAKNTIVYKNETITGLTLTAGKNYVYAKNDGTYGVKSIAPSYGVNNPLTGDFYHVLTNKWYDNNDFIITESRNYLDAIVHADANGQVAYVEEIPKIEYKDIVKANEFRGKNACTAWANIDMTTTPPTIRDSYNISAVIKTAVGVLLLYFKNSMDTNKYVVTALNTTTTTWVGSGIQIENFTTSNFKLVNIENSAGINTPLLCISVIGGKN